MTALPILYSFRRCPYAMRARMALIATGQAVELREVVLRAKPAAMLAASPKGTVPVLLLPDGRVIDQSLDIMVWALRAADPEGWLDGHDAALVEANDGPFKYHLDRYKYPQRHGSDPQTHRMEGVEILRRLEERLERTPFLHGRTRGLSDIAIFPFVRQFMATDAGWFGTLPLSHVRTWVDGLIASPLFRQAMVRVPPWVEGQEIVPLPAHPGEEA